MISLHTWVYEQKIKTIIQIIHLGVPTGPCPFPTLGMWVWEKPKSCAGAHKPLTREIHRETQGKEPQGPWEKLWFKAYGKKHQKYAKISKNRNKLWVNMTNEVLYSVKKRLNGSPTYLLTRGGCECSHGNLKSTDFVSSLIMFSLDILQHFPGKLLKWVWYYFW